MSENEKYEKEKMASILGHLIKKVVAPKKPRPQQQVQKPKGDR